MKKLQKADSPLVILQTFLAHSAGFDAHEVLDHIGKGKPLAAVVEQVGNGSMLRVTLLDGFQHASVQVGFAISPLQDS